VGSALVVTPGSENPHDFDNAAFHRIEIIYRLNYRGALPEVRTYS
jgi:hypothetical protein